MKREPTRIPVEDAGVQRALDELLRPLIDLCRDLFLSGRDMLVTLPNGIATEVPHGLGRRYTGYSLAGFMGAVSAGYVVETPSSDPARFIKLTASGYGADITVRMRAW